MNYLLLVMEMGFEMQDRARSLWPHLNGSVDHNQIPGETPPQNTVEPPTTPTVNHPLPPAAPSAHHLLPPQAPTVHQQLPPITSITSRPTVEPFVAPSTPHNLPPIAAITSRPTTEPSTVQHVPPPAPAAHHNLPPITAITSSRQTTESTTAPSAAHNLPPPAPTAHHNLPPIAALTSCRPPSSHHPAQGPSTAHHNLPPIAALTSYRPAQNQIAEPAVTPTAHHNLPPIAALTSCRPSSSPALKAVTTPPLTKPPPVNNCSPCPSPSSPRDRRDEHIFALPNPPRPLHPTTRAPTPFPDLHAQNSQVLQPPPAEPRPSTSDSNHPPMTPTSPIPFSVPSRSAFATVPRPQPIRTSQNAFSVITPPVAHPQSLQPNQEAVVAAGPSISDKVIEIPKNNGASFIETPTVRKPPSPVPPVHSSAPVMSQNSNTPPSVPASKPLAPPPENISLENSNKSIELSIPNDPSELERGDSAHQHLTSDGMKSYSNKNRRYLATPSCDDPVNKSSAEMFDRPPLAYPSPYHGATGHVNTQPVQVPDNAQSHRPAISPSSSQNVPVRQPQVPYSSRHPTHLPENTRPFFTQSDQKLFQHITQPQDRFRQSLPPTQIRGPIPPASANNEQINSHYYRKQSIHSNTTPTSSSGGLRPDMRAYTPYPPQRDIPHSAHSERPLAFHASSRPGDQRFDESYQDPNYGKVRYPPNDHERVAKPPDPHPMVNRGAPPVQGLDYPHARHENTYNDRARPAPSQQYEKSYPAHSAFNINDFSRSFQQQGDKLPQNYPPVSMNSVLKGYPPSAAPTAYHQQAVSSSKYQMPPQSAFPTYTSPGGLTMTPVAQRKPGPSAPQHYSRGPYPGAKGVHQPPNLTAPQTAQYPRPSEPIKQWHPPSSTNSRLSDPYVKSSVSRPTEPVKQVQLPQDLPQLHRAQLSYPPTSHERPHSSASVTSSLSPHVSSHLSQSNYYSSSSYMHQPPYHQSSPQPSSSHHQGYNRPIPPVSSSSTMNPHRPSGSQPSPQADSRGAYLSSHPAVNQHHQRVSSMHDGKSHSSQVSPQGRHHPYGFAYQQHSPGQSTPSHASPGHPSSHASTGRIPSHISSGHTPSHASPGHATPSHTLPGHPSQSHGPPGHVLAHAPPGHGSSHVSSGHTSAHASPGHATQSHTLPAHPSQSHATPGRAPLHVSSGHGPSHASPGHATQSHAPPGHATQSHALPGHVSQSHTNTGQATPPHALPGRPPAMRPSHSPYAPSRGHSQDNDTCRNPFELPLPSARTVIKSNYPGPGDRSPYETYARPSDDAQYSYPMPSARTHQRSVSGSDERQKPQISARFPPVPQSNFDLQRQIYDRMTGLQQGPPRLLEKSEEKTKSVKIEVPPMRKRESPLDLSVKTVRQSADSTRDDVDLYSPESRLASSAPKIDFNPNFTGPFVHPDAVPLPPMQSIRKFPAPAPSQPVVGYMRENVPYNRKRPADDREMSIPHKIQKVDQWKLAMDEKIEARLKSARQHRHPAAPLTPLHPPAQSVTPTNPEGLEPPARPHHDPYALAHSHLRMAQQSKTRVWSTFQPPVSRPLDSDRIVQQISQGVLPDSRLLQDHSVVDKIRLSLEEKEARLQALQAAARVKQPLPSFDAFGAEIMRTPPSYHQPPPRGSEPVPIGIQPNKKYARTPGAGAGDPDLDGLAAFLAARIRTKAEMKQMGPAEGLRPDLQSGRPLAPGVSPPRSVRDRDGRLSQSSQGSRRQLMSPGSEGSTSGRQRDPSGIRSSSETSVFDFRESDSEGETPGVEKKTLEGMRRPRKTQPKIEPEPDPDLYIPPPFVNKPDPEWDKACDMFVHQLETAPIKRSTRKKKRNPKFFANEFQGPTPLEVKEEAESKDGPAKLEATIPKKEVKVEPLEEGEVLPLPVVKDESSDDENLIGLSVVKEGRIKLVTKKQRTQASDSEWESSVEESTDSSASTSSESSSEEESEDSTVRKARKKAASSSSDEDVKKTRGVRTRNRAPSESGSDVSVKKRKPRKVISDSDDSDNKKSRKTRSKQLVDSDDEKPKGRRTRNRVASESDESSDGKKPVKKPGRIQTRQQARAAPPARMKLRSKKRGSAKGVEDDLIKFKKKLRVPDKLIAKSKKSKSTKEDKSPKNEKKTEKKAEKGEKDKKDSDNEESKEKDRNRSEMMKKRSLRGSLSMRRSNKAVQNSKRHLNKSNKRRKFRSGLDYIRKAKKKTTRPRTPGPTIVETKRKERNEVTDISAEVKSWVVNKSAGETLLHRAARLGYADVVAYCLESLQMPPSTKDNAGYTPLHEACTRGHTAVAEYLMQYGANVSESAPGGVRPLHQAVENNHVELVRLLLAYGADPLLATYTGQTSISLATHEAIRDLLQKHMADVLGDDAPKWQFDGPASVFDPKWFTDSLSEPPSPATSTIDIEMEASKAVLPPLFRLTALEGELHDPAERWVLLSDLVLYTKAQSSEEVLQKLPLTIKRKMTDQVFKERATCCTLLMQYTPDTPTLTLLRYDDAVRRLLDVEVTSVSVIDR